MLTFFSARSSYFILTVQQQYILSLKAMAKDNFWASNILVDSEHAFLGMKNMILFWNMYIQKQA